ncbi:MAG: VanW family protein [bacterium]|nr:VanW family protein [bacterium]
MKAESFLVAFIKSIKFPKLLRLFSFFLIGATVGLFLLVIGAVLVVTQIRRSYTDLVYPNVILANAIISGKNSQELSQFLTEKETEINKGKVIFVWSEDQQTQWEITPGDIDFSLDKAETTRRAFSFGRQTSGLNIFPELYHLFLVPQIVEPKYEYSRDKLDGKLDEMAKVVEKPTEDALFDFRDGKVLNFQKSEDGQRLEKEKAKNLIVGAFARLDQPVGENTYELPVEEVKAKVSTDQSNNLGIKEVLGEGESFFTDSISSRVHNIALASSRLHGIVVPPGEVFSFVEHIGEISAATGYKQAYVIRDKQTILEDGGGVCQVSTTMFRAALNAGLPIIERKAHYYRVGFYEQGGYSPGLDATVYPPSPDFKFQNDTSVYLLIQVNLNLESKRLEFVFYGTPDGRKTELTKPVISSKTPPPEPVYIDDPTLPVGETKRRDQSHWGAKVSFKRSVWFADGRLKEEKDFLSSYVPWPEVWLRGTKTE